MTMFDIDASKLISSVLGDQVSSLVGMLINEGRNIAAGSAGARVAQYSAILDETTCPLCEELDEQIFEVGSPEFDEYTPRIHNNCRCIWVYINAEEERQPTPNFEKPLSDLVKNYGGLVGTTITSNTARATTAGSAIERSREIPKGLSKKARRKIEDELEDRELMDRFRGMVLGGQGSGNWGHDGRPGEVGGSGEGGGIYEWQAGSPSEDDTFEANAKELGLEIKEEQLGTKENSLIRSYVTLNRPATLYHATKAENVDSIAKNGINKSVAVKNGRLLNATGVYLTGSKEMASTWRGSGTSALKIVVPEGTKLYQDVQSNAVFVKDNVPPEWIKH